MIELTKRQREILTMLRNGADLAVDGLEVWCGDERTSRALFNFLVSRVLISADDSTNRYYHINESGRLLLTGRQDIYRMADGHYVENWLDGAQLEVRP